MTKRIRLFFFLLALIALGRESAVFAQTDDSSSASQPVSFTVEIGKLICDGGGGSAPVVFRNDPTEGGSYEVYGDAITRNEISLGRSMSLPAGIYRWRGVPNDGYVAVPPSIGEFTIKKCSEASASEIAPKVQPVTQTVTGKTTPDKPSSQESLRDDTSSSDLASGTSTARASENVARAQASGEPLLSSSNFIFFLAIVGVSFILFHKFFSKTT